MKYHACNVQYLPNLSAFIVTFDYFRYVKLIIIITEFRIYDIKGDYCNCAYFLSHKFCKHLLATKIQTKTIELPDSVALANILEGKRSPGRPEHVGGALERDWHQEIKNLSSEKIKRNLI